MQRIEKRTDTKTDTALRAESPLSAFNYYTAEFRRGSGCAPSNGKYAPQRPHTIRVGSLSLATLCGRAFL